jgi:heat shock protein HtpX
MIIFLFYIPAAMLLMPFLAKLVYFGISRKREYLADASSALYTRYPEGLASALEKIAGSPDQLIAARSAIAPIFIVNPFREQGMAASDITSTHPPVSRRIAILRAMAYASYVEYDRAYREVRGLDKSVIPPSGMSLAGTGDIRPAFDDDLDRVHRARATSNLLWSLNNYKLITCACGTRMRLPPSFKLTEVKCPHCGQVIPVSNL